MWILYSDKRPCEILKYSSPIQGIIWLRNDEQPIHSIKNVFHCEVCIVVSVEYVVADPAHTVNVAVVHLS